MSPYVIVDAATSRNPSLGAHTDGEVKVYLDYILPVFSSLESFSEFSRAQHPEEDPVSPTPLEVDSVKLAAMAGELEGVKLLAFDPIVLPSGTWVAQDRPWSVRMYCRYVDELDRTVNRLRAEVKEKQREKCSDPEYLDGVANIWVALQFDGVDGDVRARVEEWELEDDF